MSDRRKITCIRGVPGSGKSTLAREIAKRENRPHFEADMFFDQYLGGVFDRTYLSAAHSWCLSQTIIAYLAGKNPIVANTFIQLWSLREYEKFAENVGAEFEVITATGNYQNLHGVADVVVARMKEEFQSYVPPHERTTTRPRRNDHNSSDRGNQ